MSLAAYIRDDLKHRFHSTGEPPCKLTLPALAEYYEVSVTPVRAAIAELLDEGVLKKLPNGRLQAGKRVAAGGKKKAVVQPAKPARPPATGADWDQLLVNEVMLASLHTQAVYLREEALAKKFKVGRSVIRQALGRLAGAGLIEHIPRCGWLVHPIREDDMAAFLEVREALEIKALDLARPHLDRERLEELLMGNPESPEEDARLDNRLHQYLIEKSGNRYIQSFFRQYTAAYYTAAFDYAAPEAHVVAQMAAQHRNILQALIAKHWAKARRALSEHIWEQRPVLMRLAAEAGKRAD